MFTQGKFMGYYWGVGAFLSKHPNGGIPGGFFVNGETNSIWVWDFLNKKWIDSNRVEGPLQGIVDDPATFEPNAKSGIKTTYLYLSNKPGNITFTNFLNAGVPIEVSTETNAVIMLFWNGDYWETSAVPVFGDVSDKAEKDLSNVSDEDLVKVLYGPDYDSSAEAFREFITTVPDAIKVINKSEIDNVTSPGSYIVIQNNPFERLGTFYSLLVVSFGFSSINMKRIYDQRLFGEPDNEVLIRTKIDDGAWSEWENPLAKSNLSNVLSDVVFSKWTGERSIDKDHFLDFAGWAGEKLYYMEDGYDLDNLTDPGLYLGNDFNIILVQNLGGPLTQLYINNDPEYSYFAIREKNEEVWSEWKTPFALADLSNVNKVANTAENGLMSSSDKQKLDNILFIEIDLNIAENEYTIEDPDAPISFMGNNSFNDIVEYICSGNCKVFFSYKYTREDMIYVGNFSYEANNDGANTTIEFNSGTTNINLILERMSGLYGGVQVVVNVP